CRRPAMAVLWTTTTVGRRRIETNRRRNYAHLAARLSQLRGAHALRPSLPPDVVPYVFPLYVDEPERSYQKLRAVGVPLFRWDDAWPGTPSMPGDYGIRWSSHVFQIACHQDLQPRDIEQ